MPDRMPERMSDRMSEYMPQGMSDRMSEYVSYAIYIYSVQIDMSEECVRCKDFCLWIWGL